jgi:NAD+ synthase
MNNDLPLINPQEEVEIVTTFIRNTFKEQKKEKAVIAFSGGIDSATSLYLLERAIGLANITILNLPYFNNQEDAIRDVLSNREFKDRISIVSIKEPVDELIKILDTTDDIRMGNIMARVRMTIVFDYAKKLGALVCGTENKSEHMLGYYTRFGDGASDIEPIRHLYKTQVIELAKYLRVPESIVKAKPTAGLWSGQDDESELGFSYKEADQVMYLHTERKMPEEEIIKLGFKNTFRILKTVSVNSFKQNAPYSLEY